MLAQVLRNLPPSTDPNLLAGVAHFEDAGVYRLNDSTAIVVTLDFFPPLVDDPFVFGQIAAANSLSDVYAVGGRPLVALNIVGFPDKELPTELLTEILRGGAERVTRAGAVVAGGHSVRDAEIKYGLSVTGIVDPRRMLSNAGAKPGDVLVLTKPIGGGVLTTAAKSGKIPEADLAEAIDVMVDLNAGAAAAMLEAGAHAATDITGFGLIGHAREMADAGGVTLRIQASAVPLLQHALCLAKAGIITRAHRSTLEFLGARLHAEGVAEPLLNTLADAQTSGGLLICIAPAQVEALLAGCRAAKTRAAAIIGDVLPQSEHAVVLI